MGIHPIRHTSLVKAQQLPKRYQRFASIALQLADTIDRNVTHQLCALVVKKNRVLSIGYNSSKTHPIMDTRMQMIHAECDAILRCPEAVVDGAEVIVARIKPSGKPGLARPCEVCEKILKRFGVRRVFYTTNSEDPDNPEIEEMRL